ncbi:MAG: hypothetical protein LBJ22_00830 [Synergistaceae bacterium]|jgi:hypothetical protein|nr:hypothetical protein [Synergistaceae bacterium]
MWKVRKIIFAALLIFVLAPVSWAADPQDALSAKPETSIYWAARLDDLGGTLQSILSPANIEMFATLVEPQNAQGIRIATNLASQLPAKSVAFVVGVTADGETPFFQAAISIPEQMQPKLDLVAGGQAKPEDLITLLLGDAALLFAQTLSSFTVQEGPEGPYYAFGEGNFGGPFLAARENLLLIALSPADMNASLATLGKAESRLAFKRSFESPNYALMHLDTSAFANFVEEEQKAEMEALRSYFKAPLETEMAFDAKPGKFLVSAKVNLEAFKDIGRWEKMTPKPGGGLFLAGGGKLLFGLGALSSFRADEWKINPDFAAVWNRLFRELEKKAITERDIENLLTGSISLVFGSDATILGKQAPGFYIALNGQEGAASKILSKIVDDEALSQAVPFSPLKVEGWDSLFMVDPAIVPASLLLGVSKEILFLGVVDPKSLGERPELLPEASELFKEDLIFSGFFDLAAMWQYLRKEVGDPASNVGFLFSQAFQNDAAFGALVKDLLNAEFTVSSVKLWGPALDKGFTELTLVDVPQEKRLLPKLVNLAASVNARPTNVPDAGVVISELRNLKAATMMFYADNLDDIEAGKFDDLINSADSAEELLGKYLDDEIDEEYLFVTVQLKGEKKWLVGCDLSDQSPNFRKQLQEHANGAGLIDEEGNPYSGGDLVFMIAR